MRHPLHVIWLVILLAFPATTGCSRRTSSTEKPASDANPHAKTKDDEEPTEPPSVGPIRRIAGPKLLEDIANSGAKGTLVNAWASWCGPCRREFPMLVALKDNMTSRGIDVVFVSVDEQDGEQDAVNFAQERGVVPPILVAERPLGPFKQALNPKWPGMLPATFLFDGEGKLRYFWGGPVYENELLPVVEGFLAGKDIDGQANFGLSPGKDLRHQR